MSLPFWGVGQRVCSGYALGASSFRLGRLSRVNPIRTRDEAPRKNGSKNFGGKLLSYGATLGLNYLRSQLDTHLAHFDDERPYFSWSNIVTSIYKGHDLCLVAYDMALLLDL